MYNHVLYLAYWAVNALVLYLFGTFAGNDVVLGNWKFGATEASIYASFWVTFLVWCFWDFAMAKGLKFDTTVVTIGYFWSVNLFSFWLVSRFSQYFGFGVTGFIWPVMLGFVAHFLQRFARILVVRGSSEN